MATSVPDQGGEGIAAVRGTSILFVPCAHRLPEGATLLLGDLGLQAEQMPGDTVVA